MSNLDNLAKRIKSGKYTDVPWELMKGFWPGCSDQQARRKLQHWAEENGIEYEIQAQRVKTGKLTFVVPVVVFSSAPPPAKTPS